MKYLKIAIVCILVFLAVSSGITKIMLMEQDVVFFGKYGFTNPILVAFGITQLVGGLMMFARKTRLLGAAIVAITFVISAVLLILEGTVVPTLVTLVALVFLGLTMHQSRTS